MGGGWEVVWSREKGGWRGYCATRDGRERLCAMRWVGLDVVWWCVQERQTRSLIIYRRTFRDTRCGSLTASWDGYRWWLMAGGHVDN